MSFPRAANHLVNFDSLRSTRICLFGVRKHLQCGCFLCCNNEGRRFRWRNQTPVGWSRQACHRWRSRSCIWWTKLRSCHPQLKSVYIVPVRTSCFNGWEPVLYDWIHFADCGLERCWWVVHMVCLCVDWMLKKQASKRGSASIMYVVAEALSLHYYSGPLL